MTKNEMKKGIAIKHGISQVEAEKWIDAVFDEFAEGLKQNGRVSIYNVLTAEIKDTKPRSGEINGTEYNKPAGKRIKTKYSPNFEVEVLGE